MQYLWFWILLANDTQARTLGYWMKELRIPKRLSKASGFRKSSIPFVTSSCLPCYLHVIDSFHARINVKLYLVWFFPFGRLQLNDLTYVVWGCRPSTPFCPAFSFQISRENKPVRYNEERTANKAKCIQETFKTLIWEINGKNSHCWELAGT